MRLSRNHNWGHPVTIDFIADLSRAATGLGWRGLYVGDISQPRGGPVKGHASHQTGLDIDIWYTPGDRASTSAAPSASGSAAMIVRAGDQRSLNRNWTASHSALIEAAARDRRVERIFVTAPVKLELCRRPPAAATPAGCARSGPGGTTTTISTSG